MAKLTITRAGNVNIVTDGKRTRKSVCATPTSAKALETRLTSDRTMALKWMKTTEPVQLELPLETTNDI